LAVVIVLEFAVGGDAPSTQRNSGWSVAPGRALRSATASHFDLTRAHFRVTSIARAKGVPLLDLTPAFVQFRQADPRRRPPFFAHDKHFTPLGHCLAASLVAQWLVPTGRSAPLDACR
jgi:hypothetical protein